MDIDKINEENKRLIAEEFFINPFDKWINETPEGKEWVKLLEEARQEKIRLLDLSTI